MKCQRKASPYSACLASRSWARFSPTTVTPASASDPMSASETYFVAATTVTSGPTCRCTSVRRERICSGDSTDHSLHAAGAAIAAVGEEELGVVARAEVEAVDATHARPAKRSFGSGPEIELAVVRQVGVEELRHLRPYLVATRADRRADHGRLLARPERRPS